HHSFPRQTDRLVRTLEPEAADALALAADDDRRRSAVVDLVVEKVAGLVGGDNPDALFLQRVDRLAEIRDVGDEQMLARAGARLGDRGGETDRAVVRDDDAIDARALRRSEQHAEVLRILQRGDDEHERWPGERVEVK